jgi:hypothetical protein
LLASVDLLFGSANLLFNSMNRLPDSDMLGQSAGRCKQKNVPEAPRF